MSRPEDDRIRRAVTAAAAVARAHGIAVDDPRVLHDGANVVVHLAPAPLVARVATLTRLLRDGTTSFAREVSLAGALAAAGAPVVPPSELVPPGPHEHEGTLLSFWPYVEVLPQSATPPQAAAAWIELRGYLDALPPTSKPLDTPLGDLTIFVERAPQWGVAPDVLDRMAGRLERLHPRLDGEIRQLHGDAHPGNLLATADGFRWADMEDSCSGPPQWDLVALRTTRRLDGRAALDAIPRAPTDDELRPWLELRRLHVAAWSIVIARGHPEWTREAATGLAELVTQPW
jgi:aminoglycoside phosphotransferase (APT) family kinase protein